MAYWFVNAVAADATSSKRNVIRDAFITLYLFSLMASGGFGEPVNRRLPTTLMGFPFRSQTLLAPFRRFSLDRASYNLQRVVRQYDDRKFRR